MFGSFCSHDKMPRVLVLGLGQSGLAMARWCAKHGCAVRVADTRVEPPMKAQLDAIDQIESFVSSATFTNELLENIDLVAISPGLVPHEPHLAALLAHAEQLNIPIWGELDFFSNALNFLAKEGYQPKVLAITGTNGKTTITKMTALLCRKAGKSVMIAGNVSPSLLEQLSLCLSQQDLPEIWVLELSSFQLYYSSGLKPDAAVIINLTQDHLDWHQTFDAYAQAKAKIVGPKTTLVLNRDELSLRYQQQLKAILEDGEHWISFGLSAPERLADFGMIEEHGLRWIVVLNQAQEKQAALEYKRLMPVNALRVQGMHNVLNAMAALALTTAINLPLSALLHGLREYQGEPHRVEPVAIIEGVEYIDDSKGTNVGATVAALNGLAKSTYLIMGGEGKSQDFSPLLAPVKEWCKAVFLIGKDALTIKQALLPTGVELIEHQSLEQATRQASELAALGEIVLLSPACASFDMFKNYEHRAQIFKQTIADIALEKGVVL